MSALLTAVAALAAPITNQIGYGLGELTGFNEKLRQDQLQQQQALMNMQKKATLH